jgi:uncharacterized RDD family membrane protein YckC
METMFTPVQVKPQAKPVIRLKPASRGSRFLAAMVDAAAVLVIWLPALIFQNPVLFLAGICAFAVLQMFLLSRDGQSVGKRVLGIRIVKNDTEANGGFVSNVLLRVIVNAVLSFIPFYTLVDILLIFRDDRRCIHDMIAGTKVVKG